MDYIPNLAIAMATGLLIVTLVFVVHVIFSRIPDAYLQFLLDLMKSEEELPPCSSAAGTLPSIPHVK